MRFHILRAVVSKDLCVMRRSSGVLVPLLVVPMVVLVLLPAILALLPTAPGAAEQLVNELPLQLATPELVQAQVASLSPDEKFLALTLLHYMAPIYLLVPLIVSSVIAADTFAGERERKTLESLLYLPATDTELLMAKLLAAWIPAVCVGVIGFLIYGLTINLAGWPVMQRVFFPTAPWLVIGAWVMPAISALGLVVGVLISSRMRTVQEASQLGSIVVIPLVVVLLGQVTGRIHLDVPGAALLGAFLWLASVSLILWGKRWCTREALLTR